MKKEVNVLRFLDNERGMTLVTALLIMAVLVVLGSAAAINASKDLTSSGNYKTSAQAFYAAEAGIEEARARLRANFSPTGSRIVDSAPTDEDWDAHITTADSLQSALAYTVTIKHKTWGGHVLYWRDANGDGKYEMGTTAAPNGQNIYLITSSGTSTISSKTLEAAVTRLPPITTPAALYVEAATDIQGTSTHIIGTDPPSCGTRNLPGIATTLSTSTITSTGNPTVSGSTSSTWSVTGGATNMDVQAMIDGLKGSANYSYTYTDNQTDTGMNWGTPIVGNQDDPSSCSVSNIVYYNMNGAEIRLAGGSSGCGILLINGDFEANGGFNWYGLVVVTGSVTIAGGGNKNITGSVLAGGTTQADLVGGNTSIVYCSSAVNNQTMNRALRILSLVEK